MSGGFFDYQQYRIGQIADDIRLLIDTNHSTEINKWGDRIGRGYPPEVIQRFRDAVAALRLAQVYAQRVDWLVSGDDGADSFLIRLEEDLRDVAIR